MLFALVAANLICPVCAQISAFLRTHHKFRKRAIWTVMGGFLLMAFIWYKLPEAFVLGPMDLTETFHLVRLWLQPIWMACGLVQMVGVPVLLAHDPELTHANHKSHVSTYNH
jgi:hypothetical protein